MTIIFIPPDQKQEKQKKMFGPLMAQMQQGAGQGQGAPQMPQMPFAQAQARPPKIHTQKYLESVVRFFATVPVGAALSCLNIDIEKGMLIWLGCYLVALFIIFVFKLAKKFVIVKEIPLFFSHLLAMIVSYVIAYNVLLFIRNNK